MVGIPLHGFPRRVLCRTAGDFLRVAHLYDRLGMNVYFGVNPRRGTGGRADVVCGVTLHVDVDCPDLCLGNVPVPTVSVWSGGGWHLYWVLSEPCHEHDEVEALNRGLAAVLNADDCWDVSRILRVPGTTNRPTSRKAEKGRCETLCRLSSVSGVLYTLEDIRAVVAPLGRSVSVPVQMECVTSVEPPPEHLHRKLGFHIDSGDRSKNDWRVAMRAVSIDSSWEFVARCVMHNPHGKALERGESYLRLTVGKVLALVEQKESFYAGLHV